MTSERRDLLAAGPPSARTGAALGGLSALQVSLAFAVQVIVLWRLGAGTAVDTYLLAFAVPQLVSVVLIDPLRTLSVPEIARRHSADLVEYSSTLLSWTLLVAIGITTLLGVATFAMRPWLPNPTDSPPFLTLLFIGLSSIAGAALTAVTSAYGQAIGRFVLVATGNVLPYLIAIPALLLFVERFGIVAVAWMQVAIVGLPGLILWLILGPRHRSVQSPAVLMELTRSLSIVAAGSALARSTFAVDRMIASLFGPGSVAVLDFATRANGALTRVVNQGIVTPIVPSLARSIATSDVLVVERTLRNALRTTILVTVGLAAPVVIVSWVALCSFDSQDTGLRVGQLTGQDIHLLGLCIIATIGIVIGGTTAHLYSNALYSDRRPGIVTAANVSTVIAGLILRAVGAHWFGMLGLAIAISFTQMAQSVTLGHFSRTRVARGGQKTGKGARS